MTDQTADAPIALTAAVSDRYRVQRELGRGGMATVYLARDLKHDRDVAMKVLDPELGAVLGAERFLSEIRVTANLQHPNLLPLFDSGSANGLLFYVMPFVDGESLRARLSREKQLPIDEALRIAAAVASALDYAHRRGVIHRDLKPENILLHEGQPLVADFGIALAVSNAGGARVTQTGLSLGTPQYMSPEQATGDRAIDARADVYALGAVTYEMLAGEPPHTGTSAQAIIARVLTERPRPVRSTRPNTPAHVEAALDCALEKLAADRFSSAHEFADALTGAHPVPSVVRHSATSAAASAPTSRDRWLRVVPWVLAAALGVAAAWPLLRPKPPAPVLGTFTIPVADGMRFGGGSGSRVAISPDGAVLVYALQTTGGRQQLYLRRLDDTVARPIPGTESGGGPAFTPDGNSIVFIGRDSRTDLRRGFMVPVTGATPREISTAASFGLSVDENGRVLDVDRRGLNISSGEGGQRRLLVAVDSTRSISRLGWPVFLPGGTHALVSYNRRGGGGQDSTRIAVVSTNDGSLQDLGTTGLSPQYAAPGYLLFGRPPADIYAAPFSLSKRRITGTPIRLITNARIGTGGAVSFGVSRNGTLVFIPGSDPTRKSTLLAVDRHGVEQVVSRADTAYTDARLSPDGRHIAVTITARGSALGSGGIWILGVADGSRTRISVDTNSSRPEWSTDGSQVFYREQSSDSAYLWSRPWDLSGPPRLVARGARLAFQELSFGPPRGFVAIRINLAPTSILIATSDSLGSARPLFDKVSNMFNPRISPSGTLLAFSSDETGRAEVYVTPVPGPGPRVPVSIGGGSEPMWSRDGKTLFFRGSVQDLDARVMSATIVERPSIAVTRRDTLFADSYDRTAVHADYDVFPDGRLLMRRPVSRTLANDPVSPVVVINWQRLLEKTGRREQP